MFRPILLMSQSIPTPPPPPPPHQEHTGQCFMGQTLATQANFLSNSWSGPKTAGKFPMGGAELSETQEIAPAVCIIQVKIKKTARQVNFIITLQPLYLIYI